MTRTQSSHPQGRTASWRRGAAMLIAALGLTTTASSYADRPRAVEQRFTDFAEVIEVVPRYREVGVRAPRQECWTEQVRYLAGDDSYGHDYRHGRDEVIVREGYSSQRQHRGNADLVVGGLIGGVIGNQLGRNSSRDKRAGATVAGAIIGSAVANESRDHRHGRPEVRHYRPPTRYHAPRYEVREVTRCRDTASTRYEQRMQGYDVTYRYRGQTYTTTMDRDPGSRLELQVSVSPARR